MEYNRANFMADGNEIVMDCRMKVLLSKCENLSQWHKESPKLTEYIRHIGGKSAYSERMGDIFRYRTVAELPMFEIQRIQTIRGPAHRG